MNTDLDAGEITVHVDGFALPVYFARPQLAAFRPILLVVQEIFGVHEHIRDVCRRLASEGYYALAPELYARQGSVAGLTDINEIIAKVVRRVPDMQVLADLDAVAEHARKAGGDPARLGITGFCWGGRITWLYAAHQVTVKAAAAWYGKLATGPYSTPEMQPRQPLDVAGELHGAVLGLYGGKDDSIPLSDVAQMRDALQRAGKSAEAEIVVYPDAGHAFLADYRPHYHEPSAKDAWARMLAWFHRYL